jgi:hypothetical protein
MGHLVPARWTMNERWAVDGKLRAAPCEMQRKRDDADARPSI